MIFDISHIPVKLIIGVFYLDIYLLFTYFIYFNYPIFSEQCVILLGIYQKKLILLLFAQY